MKKEYLSYGQVSEMLGLSMNTLYSMVHRKMIPFIRISDRIVRFERDEIEEWLDRRKAMTRGDLSYERKNVDRGNS